MKPLRDLSIRLKITGIVFVVCSVAVFVACTVFAAYDITTFRRSLANQLATTAEITGANTTAALEFGDNKSAEETLRSLHAQPHIVEGGIYTREGAIFAVYLRNPKAGFTPPSPAADTTSITAREIIVFRRIQLAGDTVGTIYLKSDLDELYARIQHFLEILLVVGLASLGTAYPLAMRLQRVISEPILELAQTALAVSSKRDYSLRVTKKSQDEIGFLYDRFNQMLRQIEERDTELVWARDELETRVNERTRELQREVAERIQAEEKLRVSFKELEDLQSALDQHCIVARTDPRGIITFANDKFCAIAGYSREELIGQDHRIINSKYHPEEFINGLWTTIRSGRVWKGEIKNRAKDGTIYWVDTTIVPFCDAQGAPCQFIAIRSDITSLKSIEEELRGAMERAEAASRAKSEFLANMSHEIRTPMNGILGMTELALDTQLNIEQREYLGMVKSSAESLLTLINDILDFSKIEAGKLDLEAADFSLRDGLGETMKALGFRAHQKQLELAWSVGEDVPDRLSGDLGRLRQVVVNLVGNSVKFTEHGEIVVEVTKDKQEGRNVALHFRIRDTGIGIPRDKQAMVFGAFTQADGSTTRKYGGTGLGLAITSRLVDLMGGKIWVESEVGRGSTFHFTTQLTISDVQAAPVELADPGSLRGLHVLVVDDNKTNTTILAGVLASWGMSVETVESAKEALAALDHPRPVGRSFALIITDLRMPDMDGFQLFEEARRKPDVCNTPFLLLGSGGQLGERQRCEEMGISGYLTKPVQPSELFNAILGALPQLTEGHLPRPAVANSPEERKEGMKVLVAEDNAVNRTLATRLLEKHGHTVVTAVNGREALDWVGREAFDLVLMDVQMPEMGGLEATTAIRKKEAVEGGHLPIIALTAHAMKGDRELCIEAGADDYLTKPIRTEEFFAALERIKLASPSRHEHSPPPEKPSASDAIDLAAALERVDGDRALLQEIARLFEDECPKAMAEIRAALENRDAKALQRLAHTLKGSSASLGALAVSQAAADLEHHARAGDLNAARDIFKILTKDIAHLHLALAALFSEVSS